MRANRWRSWRALIDVVRFNRTTGAMHRLGGPSKPKQLYDRKHLRHYLFLIRLQNWTNSLS